MTLTLLLDLDDTLIGNEMTRFIPAYFQKFSSWMGEFADSDLLLSNLMTATQQAMNNQDPAKNDKKCARPVFLSGLGGLAR